MAGESIGDDKGDLKRLLKIAIKEPVHMAFAIDGNQSAIKLDKVKNPKALMKLLQDGMPSAKIVRFGTAIVDAEEPKKVTFQINKLAGGGTAKKLAKALKGTGFSKVTLMTEDGEVEEAQEEEEEPQEEPTAAAGAAADPEAPAAPAAAAPEPAAEDAGALTGQLTALVKQMVEVIKKDPSAKAALAQLATDAQASIKGGDLRQAAAGIEILRQAIADASGPGAAAAPANGATPANGKAAGSATAQQLAKSKTAWTATRTKVDADVQKLKKAIADATKNDNGGHDIEKLFDTAVQPLMETLSDELSELLDRASQAQDSERGGVMADVQRVIATHLKFVESNPIIGHLDDNPFLPISIGKTLTATLQTLSGIAK